MSRLKPSGTPLVEDAVAAAEGAKTIRIHLGKVLKALLTGRHLYSLLSVIHGVKCLMLPPAYPSDTQSSANSHPCR